MLWILRPDRSFFGVSLSLDFSDLVFLFKLTMSLRKSSTIVNFFSSSFITFFVFDYSIYHKNTKNSHGDGFWGFPGGHLEFNEIIEDCAIRETKEETGINIINIKKAYFTNDIFTKENKHYVTLFIVSDYDSGEIQIMEPEKCDGWDWFDWDNLPKPLFIPIENLLKENFNPFDY